MLNQIQFPLKNQWLSFCSKVASKGITSGAFLAFYGTFHENTDEVLYVNADQLKLGIRYNFYKLLSG